jgi:hypothetical protein
MKKDKKATISWTKEKFIPMAKIVKWAMQGSRKIIKSKFN